MKRIPQNRGLRSRSKYGIDVSCHLNIITRLMITNASEDDIRYYMYSNREIELISGEVESNTIIDRSLRIDTYDTIWIDVILKSIDGTRLDSKRVII
jgi:hypothetical protein